MFSCLSGTVRSQTGDLPADLAGLHIRHRTAHYALAGTISDDRFVEYGRCLEYIHKEYADGFAELLDQEPRNEPATKRTGRTKARPTEKRDTDAGLTDPPSQNDGLETPAGKRFSVIIFATDEQYNEFGHAYFTRGTEHTRGMFVPSADLLLIRDEGASHETYEVLFHEAFHQFARRYVPAMPTWLNEGLATYYGTARPTKSGLVFDRPRSAWFRITREAASARKLIPLDELMASDASTFYGAEPINGLRVDRTTLSYAQSYTLVCYILSDREGREHLRKYIRALADARSGDEARRITGELFDAKLLDAIIPAWLKFVNRR